jgi:hypothetical protein
MSENMNWARRDLDYEPPEVDTSTAHSARVYDYFLGGKDNYPADRVAAEHMLQDWPALGTSLRQSRGFMHRVTRYLAAERGIDQFLDIGTGIPTSPNLHEITQRVNPAARVVYADNDPIVLTHAQALLTSTPQGRVAYIHADMRDPDAILGAPDFRATLDLSRPVALTILLVLHLIVDDAEASDLIGRYMSALPSGSMLALSAGTTDAGEGVQKVATTATAHGIRSRGDRTKAAVEALFGGCELVEPGVVFLHRWHPDAESVGYQDSEIGLYGGVAVKP